MKDKIIQDLLDAIRKDHGDGSVTLLDGKSVQVPVISSGSVSLDDILGPGGYPKGRIVEIFGPESSGKTTIALHAIAEAQAAGGVVAFIDAEHALDMKYAEALGVDIKRLVFSQPDYGEQALDIVSSLTDSGKVSMIVVDSVAALTPKAEIEGEMGDIHVGAQARLMGQALRKLVASAAKHGTIIIFINQIRMKIGVMYGSPETTPGGNALKFYASVRLDVRRKQQIQEGDTAVGNQCRVKVVKNKVAPPFRETELDIVWGQGIDWVSDLIGFCTLKGIIERKGSWFSLGDRKLGNGMNAVAKALREDAVLLEQLDIKARQTFQKDG